MSEHERKEREKDRHQAEFDRNYEEFRKQLPTLLEAHRNKYALMKDTKILGYYSTDEDALTAAQSFITDRLFSIHEVTDATLFLRPE